MVACAAAVCGVQVPSIVRPNRVSATGGSPFENVATTVPAFIACTQESRISLAEKPAARRSLESDGKEVNTPFTCEGVQLAAALGGCGLPECRGTHHVLDGS